MLALRTGAPLRPGRHLLPGRRASAAPGSGPPSRRERRAACATMSRRVTQDLAHRFEELIRAAPEQWLHDAAELAERPRARAASP